jgi:ribonuclease HIII
LAQNTLVVKLPASSHAAFRARLGGGDFEFRQVPHAAFSVKGEGVVATLYLSGKLVVQGPDPEAFLARWTELAAPEQAPAAEDSGIVEITGEMIGSDETGKGDYFGPLVVAAVRIDGDMAEELSEWGVTDSKALSDKKALKLGVLLRAKVAYSVQRLDPASYNKKYPEYGTLNPLLADMHADAIRTLAKPGVRVLVDQFANARVMQKALRGVDVKLEQAHRAERNVAVAAASVIARQEFLLALEELGEQHGVALRKGAGAPTDEAGAEFVRQHGLEALGNVAKLHFKNTEKVKRIAGLEQ